MTLKSVIFAKLKSLSWNISLIGLQDQLLTLVKQTAVSSWNLTLTTKATAKSSHSLTFVRSKRPQLIICQLHLFVCYPARIQAATQTFEWSTPEIVILVVVSGIQKAYSWNNSVMLLKESRLNQLSWWITNAIRGSSGTIKSPAEFGCRVITRLMDLKKQTIIRIALTNRKWKLPQFLRYH